MLHRTLQATRSSALRRTQKLSLFALQRRNITDGQAIDLLEKHKQRKNLTFKQIGDSIGRHEAWVAKCLYRQARATPEEARGLVTAFGLTGTEATDVAEQLTFFPNRCENELSVPRDPTLYRLYEACISFGRPIKAMINEKFGDGIMSAIDFTMSVEREKDPKGDRVVITFNGKFLPYKKY